MYYKPIAIINVDSSVINKLETSLTDDARVIIYDRHMFIEKTTRVFLRIFFIQSCCTEGYVSAEMHQLEQGTLAEGEGSVRLTSSLR
jgi:hypothetical protein